MSYCRWSSLNWRCDVYVYEDVSGGWTIHVAGWRRIIPPIPDLPLMNLPRFGAKRSEMGAIVYPTRWHCFAHRACLRLYTFWHNQIHMRSLGLIPLRPIGLKHDGERFNVPAPGTCAVALENLRAVGYIVPQYAIDALCAEQVELDSALAELGLTEYGDL